MDMNLESRIGKGVRRFARRFATASFAVLLAAPSALAQPTSKLFPIPGEQCSAAFDCLPGDYGKTIAPFTSSIKSFKGRFIYSNATGDYQKPTRTYRAWGMFPERSTGKIYAMYGSTVAAWSEASFFAKTNGQPSSGPPALRQNNDGEKYVDPDYTFYAEAKGSGWKTYIADGQQRLFDIATDDRGYVYLATQEFGWGILRDTGASLTSVAQVFPLTKDPAEQQQLPAGGPRTVRVVKSGSNYIAVVGWDAGLTVYDVTTPATPRKFAETPSVNGTVAVLAATTNRDFVAALDISYDKIKIISASQLAAGNVNGVNVESSPTGTFKAIAADATHIWAVENLGRPSPTFNLVKISPATGAVERFAVVIPGRLEPNQQVFLEVSGGLAAIAGWAAADGSRRSQTRLYDVRGAAPVEIPIADWFEAAYWVAPSGYVVPPGSYMSPIQALPYTYGGKTYLMYSLVGIGDVVEIQAGDSLDIRRVNGTSFGTQNPKNPNRGLGPYYGDTVTFTSSFSGQTAPNVNWDFGNPGAAGNTTSTSIGINVPYRYKGFTTSGVISATKTVTGTSSVSSAVGDSESVNLLVPSARIVHADGSLTGTLISAGGSYAGPVVVDDNFHDASDGSVEGHSGIWMESIPSASATPVTRSPLTAHLVAGCGIHSLNYKARYQDSFDAVLPAVGFTALPFSAKAKIASSDASNVTLANAGRTSTTAFKAGQLWTVKWELLSAGGSALDTKLYDSVDKPPVGSVPNYVVPKSTVAANPGSKVRLTITALLASMADSGCSSHLMSSDIFLLSPDPKVNTGACTAATTLGNCTLSADSLSNRDQTGWTYAWTVTGPSSVSTPATRTFTPAFPVPGTYSVSVQATDPAAGTSGNSLPAVSIEVTQPPCMPTPASTVYFTASASSVSPGASVSFAAKLFGSGYAWQDCDTLTWSWGDNTPSFSGDKNNALEVSHTFSSSGTFTVTLTVSNSAGAPRSSTLSIQVGTVAPPPPPPPPPPQPGNCTKPNAAGIFVGYTGPESGCRAGGTTPCKVSENVSFKVDTFGYSIQPSCDSFSWKFGDNRTGTGQTPSHPYTAAGTYTVELKVSNSAGSVTTTGPLVVSGGVCNAPANDIKLGWVGLASGCDPTKTCSPGEKVRFYFSSASNYVLQACDSVTWDFGDGEKSTSRVVQIDHTFKSNGPFQVSFAVANSTATITDLKTISFVPITKPVVSIQASATTGEPGATITFTGSAVSNATLTSRLWRVLRVTGGTTTDVRTVANESAISQRFDTDGDYRVEYTASNFGGTSDPAVADVTISNRKAFAFLLPVVARLDGLNGTKWRTDLQVFNTDPLNAPISLEFEFRGNTRQFKKTLSVDSSTKVYEDLLSILSAPAILNDAGSVIVRGSSASPPQMWSRVYTLDASGVGSYGQFVPSVPLGSAPQAAGSPGSYIVPGLEISSRFRSNLGLVNPSNETVQVTVTIADAAFGEPIGQFSVDVGPYALEQIGHLNTLVPQLQNGKPFSVQVKTTGNLPLVVYGSMIDMISNDPVYVPGIHESTQAGVEKQTQVVPGAGHLVQGNDTWRSDLVIYNTDMVPVRFNLSYFTADGTKAAEALNQLLVGKAFVQVEDVLRWPMLDKTPPDSVGIVKVETIGIGIVRYPIILQRTYKDRGPLGTFGQGIPAISPSRPNVELNKPAFIAGVRSDPSFYTNLGLVAVGNTPSKVRVTLLHEGSGKQVGASWEYVPAGATAPVALNPNQSILVGNIVRVLSAVETKGTLKIEVIEGGPVWAYASVIAAADPSCNCTLLEHTFDPEYIPAVQQGTN